MARKALGKKVRFEAMVFDHRTWSRWRDEMEDLILDLER